MPKTAKLIKVLYFYPNEFLGPEMTVYAQTIKHLDRSRFQPYLVLNADAEGESGLSERDGVIIKRWRFGTGLRNGTAQALISGTRLPLSMLGLIRYAREEGIHIVQCSAVPRTGSLGLLLARACGARLLLHYHVIPGRYAGLRGLFERVVARRADRSVAVSLFMSEKVIASGIPASRVDVVVNGADTARFNPDISGSAIRAEYGIAPHEPLIVELARIIQQKRQADVVRAFALARKAVPDLRCLLVGWEDPRYTGPFPGYRAELEHIASEAGLGSSLIIADARPEAPQVLAAADMVAMPTIEDAWNLAVTEAMASGKPVIGTRSGGITEQIEDGVTGYLVPVDSPQDIADCMVRLAKNPQLRAGMGAAARERAVRLYDETHLAADFAPIYEKMAKRGTRSGAPVTGQQEYSHS